MSDPLALLPLALAAAGGRIDGIETVRLVTAGLTLLQRCAPLVRALADKRSALLLPRGPGFLVALAASDGRGDLLLDPAADASEIARQVHDARVGAVFTTDALATMRPSGLPIVWLDDAPRTARVDVGDESRVVDLGTHFGLQLEGEAEVPGRDEECLLWWSTGSASATGHSHRALLARARQTVATRQLLPGHRTAWTAAAPNVDQLVGECLAPLLAGGEVVTG